MTELCHRRAAKTLMRLRRSTVSTEPLLLALKKYGRRRPRPTIGLLTILCNCACVFKERPRVCDKNQNPTCYSIYMLIRDETVHKNTKFTCAPKSDSTGLAEAFPNAFVRGSVKNNWALPHNILVWNCRQQLWLFSLSIICHRYFDPEGLS